MADDDVLVEIDDLYVNFYTYQGVVKAIDGIDLQIKKGETLGLVGETGCGKSVTASTIMKLILSPPGKIESGRVFFMEPPEVRAARTAYEAEARKWFEALPPKHKAHYIKEFGLRFTGFKKTGRREPLEKAPDPLLGRVPSGVLDFRLGKMLEKADKKDTVAQEALDLKYDLLRKNIEYMQLIRGRYISMIFQEPTAALNPVFTAGDQIAEVILQHRKPEMARRAMTALLKQGVSKGSYRMRMLKMIKENPRAFGTWIEKVPLVRRLPFVNAHNKDLYAEALKEATRMLDTVRIPDPEGIAKRYPYELSGGMQQRVMIAIALACNPKLLIADEPTTALDVTIQAQILKLMKDLKSEYGSSILLITHNLGVVAEMCDRVGVMYAGSMAEVASARTIFKEPLHPYTKGLMKAVPSVQQDAETLFTIRGSVPNLVRPPTGCRFHPRCDFAKEHCKKFKPKLDEIEPGHFVACHMVSGVKGYE